MTPEIAPKVVTLFRRTPRPAEHGEGLTPHETRLLRLLAEGYSYQEAADRFGVSINTPRNHIRSIYHSLPPPPSPPRDRSGASFVSKQFQRRDRRVSAGRKMVAESEHNAYL
jgi:DNA-binding CsgD family transcriptional regulator